jgi:hypothetical protein
MTFTRRALALWFPAQAAAQQTQQPEQAPSGILHVQFAERSSRLSQFGQRAREVFRLGMGQRLTRAQITKESNDESTPASPDVL